MTFWAPTPESIASSTLAAYLDEIRRTRGIDLHDYPSLWRWSVTELGPFWASVWDFFALGPRPPDDEVLAVERMPGAVWFPGARINFAARCLTVGEPAKTALLHVTEDGTQSALTYAALRHEVDRVAAGLRALGVLPGDHVAAYLTNRAEAVVGLLACAAIGAVWTIVAPDLGTPTCRSRLEQVDPVALIAVPSYRHGGRVHDRREALGELVAALPTLRHVILAEGPDSGTDELERCAASAASAAPGGSAEAVWVGWRDLPDAAEGSSPFENTTFDHPLWVLWSSGTTGAPKGIVHGHGGITLELLKALALASDVRTEDVFLFVTSTSWMVWNFLVGGLLLGATVVLHEGSPTYPDINGGWRAAAATGATVVGAGAAYLQAGQRAGARPGEAVNLDRMRILLQTGSTLPPTTWEWVMDAVHPRVWLQSISGGTDVCSVLAGANPLQPVRAARLVGPSLGVALAAWDANGAPVVGSEGELVITRPMPSMPLRFVRDPDGERYRDAYFSPWPGVWRHGDYVTVEPNGSILISGRSDATLNRQGIRMGSADIYAVVDSLEGVADSLIVGVDCPDGTYWMPLFIVPQPGYVVDSVLRERIRQAIRRSLSPRHVPDEILEAPVVPRTPTGKKLEVPVKRLLQDVVAGGRADDERGALAWFATLARSRLGDPPGSSADPHPPGTGPGGN